MTQGVKLVSARVGSALDMSVQGKYTLDRHVKGKYSQCKPAQYKHIPDSFIRNRLAHGKSVREETVQCVPALSKPAQGNQVLRAEQHALPAGALVSMQYQKGKCLKMVKQAPREGAFAGPKSYPQLETGWFYLAASQAMRKKGMVMVGVVEGTTHQALLDHLLKTSFLYPEEELEFIYNARVVDLYRIQDIFLEAVMYSEKTELDVHDFNRIAARLVERDHDQATRFNFNYMM